MRFYLPALIVIVLDQVTKQFFWGLSKNFQIVGDWVRITMVQNSGAAFGMFQGGRYLLIASSVLATLFIIFLATRVPQAERAKTLYLGLILGGAIGNLIDRIHPGMVIDFIDMGVGSHRWPVYNIADSAVTIGGILLILTFARKSDTETAVSEDAEGGSETAAPVEDEALGESTTS